MPSESWLRPTVRLLMLMLTLAARDLRAFEYLASTAVVALLTAPTALSKDAFKLVIEEDRASVEAVTPAATLDIWAVTAVMAELEPWAVLSCACHRLDRLEDSPAAINVTPFVDVLTEDKFVDKEALNRAIAAPMADAVPWAEATMARDICTASDAVALAVADDDCSNKRALASDAWVLTDAVVEKIAEDACVNAAAVAAEHWATAVVVLLMLRRSAVYTAFAEPLSE